MAIVIAELCQNHRGDRSVLREMIWAARDAGADYAKIQSIRAFELTRRERFEEGLIDDGKVRVIKRPYDAELARLTPLELDEDTHFWLVEECGRAGIAPLTTVFTRAALDFVAGLPWDAVKIASYDCASYPLLREVRERFRHVFVSTGATTDEEIAGAADILRGGDFTLLHCVTIYPTPLDEMHLARMAWLREFSPSVGFSDHSLVARDGNKASIAALAFGADVIERHFTVLPSDATRDGPVSVNPEQLRELVRFARLPRGEVAEYVRDTVPEVRTMLGVPRRPLSDAELLNRDYYRGRFASRIGDEVVYNWEERPLVANVG